VAAEYRSLDCAKLLLARGASAKAMARIDEAGIGGQTPIFHAATQFDDKGLPMIDLLLAHGADLSLSVTLPGHYERPDEFVTGTARDYAIAFSGDDPPNDNATVRRLSV
jgi:ankyrin repeat protein